MAEAIITRRGGSGAVPVALANYVKYGNFSVTTEWTPIASTISVSGNVMSVTGTGANAATRALQTSAGKVGVQGHVFYIAITGRVTNNSAAKLRLFVRDGTSGTIPKMISQEPPTENQWYLLSDTFTLGALSTGISYQFDAEYATAGVASGKVCQFKNAVMIDLTPAYGAGSEPTKSEMDAIMSTYFENSWFDVAGAYIP